jgi:7-carboxy-7-deazaguanine synthase
VKARIAEVFDSVQGEGLYLGEKQIFVRFFGCNLACAYCDTKPDCFMEFQPKELFEEIKLYSGNYRSVSFTGGEPLLQKDFLRESLKLTHAAGFKNYLDTNGTLFFELKDVIDYVDIVAMDVKLPSSTGMGRLWGMHRRFLEIASQRETFLKTVICQSTTEEDLKEAIKLIKEVNISALLVLQPDSYEGNAALTEKLERFKDICLKEGVIACMIPQMHKIIGIK